MGKKTSKKYKVRAGAFPSKPITPISITRPGIQKLMAESGAKSQISMPPRTAQERALYSQSRKAEENRLKTIPSFQTVDTVKNWIMRARLPFEQGVVFLNYLIDSEIQNLFVSAENQTISSYCKTNLRPTEMKIATTSKKTYAFDYLEFHLSGNDFFIEISKTMAVILDIGRKSQYDQPLIAKLIAWPFKPPKPPARAIEARYLDFILRTDEGRLQFAIKVSGEMDYIVASTKVTNYDDASPETQAAIKTIVDRMDDNVTLMATIEGDDLMQAVTAIKREAVVREIETPNLLLTRSNTGFEVSTIVSNELGLVFKTIPIYYTAPLQYQFKFVQGQANAFFNIATLERVLLIPLRIFNKIGENQYEIPALQFAFGNYLTRNFFAFFIGMNSYIASLVPRRSINVLSNVKNYKRVAAPKLKTKKKSKKKP